MYTLGDNCLGRQSGQKWVLRPASRNLAGTKRPRTRTTVQARAGRGGVGDLHDPWREEERREALLKYVREVQPQSVVQFAEQTHPVVVQAMRQTVLNVVGSLPPQYFEVRISSVAEALAQLMLSIMTTGYMLRSAQYRMELQKSLRSLPAHSTAGAPAAVAAPPLLPAGAAPALDCPTAVADAGAPPAAGPGAAFLCDGAGSGYAPGVQKKNVEGEVLRWHLGRGEVDRLPAATYIELLEAEVAALRARLGPQAPPAASAHPASSPFPASPASQPPLATTAGGVEVLGPDPTYVSPLPGFGERVTSDFITSSSSSSSSSSNGGGGGVAGVVGGALAAIGVGGGASAAAPAVMGAGGIPLVVGCPLGLPRNELLDYLHGLQAGGGSAFKELACSPSSGSGRAVKEAMELFVARLMGTADPEALSKLNSEFSSVELSKVLFWLMAVGYTLKSIEARMELEDGMGDGGSGSGGGGAGPSPRAPGPAGSGGNGKGGNGGGKGEGRKGFGAQLRGLLPGF